MTVDYVVPMLVTTYMVEKAPMFVLKRFARCSTGIIVSYVNKYISDKRNANDSSHRIVIEKLEEAYEDINERARYLRSNETKDMVDVLKHLSYEDITCATDIDALKKYQFYIREILEGTGSGETVVKDRNNLNDCAESIISYADEIEDPEEKEASLRIANVILNNKSLFKNAPYKLEDYNVLMKVAYRKDEFKIILDGLNFIIPKKEGGVNPRQWRYL